MKVAVQALVLIVVTAAATTAVVLPVATAQQSTQSRAPAPEIVGLPDFTRLVEQVGPGVVNITAETDASAGIRRLQRSPMPGQGEIPEIFRRMFPDMPFPGQQPPGVRPPGTSTGSGFIISADGYVLTNHHVISGADNVRVTLSDGREFVADVVGSDVQTNVALLKIEADDLPALRIGDSTELKPGEWAVAIGSPFGFDQSVTAGIVSAIGRANPYANQQYVPFIQTDVAINRGNSGGPLLNTRGEVIGINSQIFSSSGGYQGVSFAIPIGIAMGAVEQLKETGEVRRGMIGIVLQPITAETVKGFDLPDSRGALISDVTPGSAGEEAGLRVGDVVRSIDGISIRESSDLPPIVGTMMPGEQVTLGILRDGRQREIELTLGELDPSLLPGASPAAPDPSEPDAPETESSNPLGLIGQDLDADDRRAADLEPGEGVGIVRVEGLAARQAGIEPGMVVLQVGTEPVGSVKELDRALADVSPGETVMLLVRRGSSSVFLAVTPRADDSDE